MSAYRFVIVRADGSVESPARDLPDDDAAVVWMNREGLLPGDRVDGFRGDDEAPFASRVFGQEARR